MKKIKEMMIWENKPGNIVSIGRYIVRMRERCCNIATKKRKVQNWEAEIISFVAKCCFQPNIIVNV